MTQNGYGPMKLMMMMMMLMYALERPRELLSSQDGQNVGIEAFEL